MRLQYINIPWKKLEDSLNYIVDGVNANEPIEGTGIRISDGSRGKVIETASGEGGQGQGQESIFKTPDGEKAGWHQIQVVDAECNYFNMWVWGGTPKPITAAP